ncbi:hypothetical protein ACFSTC_16920 [Nonomuraea ferruginea]
MNILLLGGDADDHRPGVRTDSMHLASVDVKTGNTVLFSLPRNLENVRFKPGTPMAERFPDGFRLLSRRRRRPQRPAQQRLGVLRRAPGDLRRQA